METKYLERATLYHPGQLAISDRISAFLMHSTALIFRPQRKYLPYGAKLPCVKSFERLCAINVTESFMRSEFMQFKRLMTGKATLTKSLIYTYYV
jgi:hypothetical protein